MPEGLLMFGTGQLRSDASTLQSKQYAVSWLLARCAVRGYWACQAICLACCNGQPCSCQITATRHYSKTLIQVAKCAHHCDSSCSQQTAENFGGQLCLDSSLPTGYGSPHWQSSPGCPDCGAAMPRTACGSVDCEGDHINTCVPFGCGRRSPLARTSWHGMRNCRHLHSYLPFRSECNTTSLTGDRLLLPSQQWTKHACLSQACRSHGRDTTGETSHAIYTLHSITRCNCKQQLGSRE